MLRFVRFRPNRGEGKSPHDRFIQVDVRREEREAGATLYAEVRMSGAIDICVESATAGHRASRKTAN